LVLDAVRAHDQVWLIWATILITSLVAVVGFARAGSMVFWKVDPAPDAASPATQPAALPFVATGGLIAGIVALTVFAGPVTSFLSATSAQIFDKQGYINAVMATPRAQDAAAANAAGKPLAYYGTEDKVDTDTETTTGTLPEKTE
jgi:multicomponent K+:H+ antiporter subunit D